MSTLGIGAAPTPVPTNNYNTTPQTTGGQIYNSTPDVNWDTWNKGWNEGYNNPTASYSGSDTNFQTGYLVGQQEYAKRNNTPVTSPVPNNTGKLPVATTPSNNNGMSMNYMSFYQGWDPKAAEQDFKNAYGGDINRLMSARNGGGNTGGGDKTVSLKGDVRAAQVLNDPTANQDFQNSGLNIDDYLAAIDRESGNTMNFLQQQEDALRADQPGIEQNITSQADLLRNKALSTKEDAQSAARRLYSELQQGYRQRFGGASSAGEAAQALTANEQQRQMAQNNRTYQEAVAQVDLSATQAVQSAQSEFRNQLLAINQNRVATENERLGARRQALSDLSNKVFQIQQQRDAFKQNLALMQEQARLQNESNLKALSTNPTSNLTMNNAPATASGNVGLNNAVGYVNPSGISSNKDLLSQGIYPIQSLTNGKLKYSDGSVR